jgi:hypothetical protein
MSPGSRHLAERPLGLGALVAPALRKLQQKSSPGARTAAVGGRCEQKTDLNLLADPPKVICALRSGGRVGFSGLVGARCQRRTYRPETSR